MKTRNECRFIELISGTRSKVYDLWYKVIDCSYWKRRAYRALPIKSISIFFSKTFVIVAIRIRKSPPLWYDRCSSYWICQSVIIITIQMMEVAVNLIYVLTLAETTLTRAPKEVSLPSLMSSSLIIGLFTLENWWYADLRECWNANYRNLDESSSTLHVKILNRCCKYCLHWLCNPTSIISMGIMIFLHCQGFAFELFAALTGNVSVTPSNVGV